MAHWWYMKSKRLATTELDCVVVTVFRDLQPQLDAPCSVVVLSQVLHHVHSPVSLYGPHTIYPSLKMLGSFLLLFALSG